MSQSKTRSVIEVWTGILIGYIVSNIVWFVLAWYEDLDFTFSKNIKIVLIFTYFSFVRGYATRRVFNWYEKRKQRNEVQEVL
jgi:hypothetical protein